MFRARFPIVVLLLVLLGANAWCAAQCLAAPCPDLAKLPPCHRHHQTVKACGASVFLKTASPAPHPPLQFAGLVHMPGMPAAQRDVAASPLLELSPPPPPVSAPLRS